MLRKLSPQVLFGMVFALIGIGLVTYSVNTAWEQRLYQAEGRIADGTVLDKRKQHRHRHLVSYRFKTAAGRILEGEGEVLSHTWESLDPGSLIRVEYAAGSPRVNRAHDGRRKEGWWEWIILAAAGMLFAAVGAGIVYIARRQDAAADASRVIASVSGPHGMLDSSSQTPLQKRESSSKKSANRRRGKGVSVEWHLLKRGTAPRPLVKGEYIHAKRI